MDIKIITEPFQSIIYGFGSYAANKDYAGTAFKLSGKMWDIVKTKGIKNKGKNIWVYEAPDKVFAGVEPEHPTDSNYELEVMKINIEKYAYYKHTGSYHLIKQAGQNLRNELTDQGYEITFPNIEIYGHWTGDESKSETELLMCLK